MNIKITGGTPLSGTITPSGSKNSAVAMIPASILFQKLTLKNIPDITDVNRLIKILEKMGSKIVWDKQTCVLHVDNSNLNLANISRDDLGNMRGTSLLWGPMLARFGKFAFADLPGGCSLGVRTLDPRVCVRIAAGAPTSGGIPTVGSWPSKPGMWVRLPLAASLPGCSGQASEPFEL